MSKSSYEQQHDDEWVEYDPKGHKIACCDCGLVHQVKFRVRDGKIEYQFNRDNRSTSQIRRHYKIKVEHGSWKG